MKPSVKTFLSELYEIDPDLKAHENDIIPLIEKLLANDPAKSPDAAFVARLRTELRERAATLSSSSSSFSFLNMQKILYTLGGALSAAIIIPVVYLAVNQDKQVPTDPNAPALLGYEIQTTGREAFGDIAVTTIPPTMSARPQSGGGGQGGGGMAVAENATGIGMDSKMIAPYPMTQFEYVYNGDITDLKDTVAVYKRTPKAIRLGLSTILGSLNLGTMDLGSFNGMNLESLSFSQNTSFGYQLYVDLRNAMVSLNAQWDQWPQSKCQTEACYRAEQVTINDLLEDSEVISIAKKFATDHGVDLSHYGEPEVDNQWRRDYERATDKTMVYVPDTQRVIFPLVVDGQKTYDQGGMLTGISMGVSVKHKRVMDIWGIADRTYQKSDYAGVTDAAKIKEFISKVDRNWYDPAAMERADVDVQKATVTLGTPTVALATFFKYDGAVSEEILVPSLVFPVEKVDGPENTFFYRSTVVVPLASEMLEEQMKQPPYMPLMEGGPAVDVPAATDTEAVAE